MYPAGLQPRDDETCGASLADVERIEDHISRLCDDGDCTEIPGECMLTNPMETP